MNSNFSIGKRLRELRQQKGLSQEQLANLAEITPAYLGQLERDEKNATVRTLDKLCDAMDVPLTEFFAVEAGGKSAAMGSMVNPKDIDDLSNKILFQLKGKTEGEKQAVFEMIKLFFRNRK